MIMVGIDVKVYLTSIPTIIINTEYIPLTTNIFNFLFKSLLIYDIILW
nr:MAG TPA: hypothetical protein [Caudoviricetes sp.]